MSGSPDSSKHVNMTGSMRTALGVPASASLQPVAGVQLAVMREGQGPAIVCLHAIGHGGGDFDAFAAAVRDRFEVIRIDWPGQGRSGDDSQPASAARYAQLLVELLDRLGVRDPIIVGNSIGGAAALLYARERPVRALVLCNPGGLLQVDRMTQRACELFVSFFSAGVKRARWFRWMFAVYYRLVLRSQAAARQRARIIAAAYETAPLLRDAWRSFGQPSADLRALASSLEVPIWVAWAKRDKVISYARCAQCIARMRHARVTQFEAGHAAFLEQPEAFVQGFLGFVRESAVLGQQKSEPSTSNLHAAW
jgi:pimeloyl-ACP methyl ester carboxylesterase